MQDSEPRRHVKGLSFGDDAPCKKFAAVVAALSCCSEEIRPPFSTRTHRADVHRRDRYAHFRSPNMILGVDARGVLKAGIPRSIVKRVLGLIDFEIDPLIVGRYLELIVVIHSLRLRVQENLGNITIPKLPSLYLCVFTLIDIQ